MKASQALEVGSTPIIRSKAKRAHLFDERVFLCMPFSTALGREVVNDECDEYHDDYDESGGTVTHGKEVPSLQIGVVSQQRGELTQDWNKKQFGK